MSLMKLMPSEYKRYDSPGDGGPAPEQMPSSGNGFRKPAAVCLLDDDPSVLKATERLLQAAGWNVRGFTDPYVFLEHARRHQPPVVVIDILMPEMNGLEVQTRLGHIAPATRVIVLTSKDDPEVRTKAIEGGAFAFFLKTMDNEQFLERIRAALAKN